MEVIKTPKEGSEKMEEIRQAIMAGIEGEVVKATPELVDQIVGRSDLDLDYSHIENDIKSARIFTIIDHITKQVHPSLCSTRLKVSIANVTIIMLKRIQIFDALQEFGEQVWMIGAYCVWARSLA